MRRSTGLRQDRATTWYITRYSLRIPPLSRSTDRRPVMVLHIVPCQRYVRSFFVLTYSLLEPPFRWKNQGRNISWQACQDIDCREEFIYAGGLNSQNSNITFRPIDMLVSQLPLLACHHVITRAVQRVSCLRYLGQLRQSRFVGRAHRLVHRIRARPKHQLYAVSAKHHVAPILHHSV